MAVCNIQELIDANPCLLELNAHFLQLVKISLLCGIKVKLEGGAAPSCDIQTLLDSASCYNMLSEFELSALEAQLLCEIAALV